MLRIVKRLIESAKTFFNGDKDYVDSSANTMPKTTPKDLVDMLLSCAKANAAPWEDDLDLPSSYIVYVSRQDWKRYYGTNTQSHENRLAECLRDHAFRAGHQMVEVDVKILFDSSVNPGDALIAPRFSNTAGIDKCGGTRLSAEKQGKVPPEPNRISSPASSAHCPSTDGGVPSPAVPLQTQVLQSFSRKTRPCMTIETVEGGVFELHEGDTIGIIRDNNRALPSVCLPYNLDYLEGCSQIHGKFERVNAREWTFTNIGRNGTCINQGSNHILASEAVEVPVKEGDVFCLGQTEPAFTITNMS